MTELIIALFQKMLFEFGRYGVAAGRAVAGTSMAGGVAFRRGIWVSLDALRSLAGLFAKVRPIAMMMAVK